jgi:hypothetical protein
MSDYCVWCGKIAVGSVVVETPWKRGGLTQEEVCSIHLWRPEYATPQPPGGVKR